MFWDDEKVLEIVMLVAQYCGCTQCHWIVHLKIVKWFKNTFYKIWLVFPRLRVNTICRSKASEKTYIAWQKNLSYTFWFNIKRIHINPYIGMQHKYFLVTRPHWSHYFLILWTFRNRFTHFWKTVNNTLCHFVPLSMIFESIVCWLNV